MLKGHDIICISSIDWDFIWQGHQEIMSAFAGNGNRVLFIENTGVRTPVFRDIPRLKKRLINWFKGAKGFREEAEGLFIYSPLILPFPYLALARKVNKYLLLKALRRWMSAMDFYEPIIWTFLPTPIALDIINNLPRKLLVYYCIADFYELAGSPKKIAKTEKELIKKCDLIFVQGGVLADKCRQLNSNVRVFPFGVNNEAFENFEPLAGKVPEGLKGIKKPIIGYVGGIHRHIDFKLIRFIAKNNPEWSIALVGPVQTDISEVKDLPNVFLLGKKEFSALPQYISEFDVCIIPYDLSGYTSTVFPTKLNEYHAMGKPVVSTNLAEIINFNRQNNDLIFIGKTYEDFNRQISDAFRNKSDEMRRQRIESARNNNWPVRIEEMSAAMEDALARKSKKPVNWRESFLKLYRASREKLLTITTVVLMAYILLFYTPIVWFMASPLRISELPEKADCIVVFAGGVGESGKAGQGYEERVQYAVELYNKGYAKHILFSSGYMYVFREPLLMKALAVSLGVPAGSIILEDTAENTYENVKLTREILDKEKWNKILLVSSPYHMLRVSLTIKKIAPHIKAIYTPIPDSHFFNRNSGGKFKKINLGQIKALIHEYAGIFYYCWKGYV